MDRRNFMKLSGSALGTLSLIGGTGSILEASGANVTAKSKKKIGLQLYSLRNNMGKDPDGTLKAVADIGYSYVESYGYNGKFFGKTPLDFKKQMEDLGMKMTSSHTGFGVYDNDTTANWDAVKKNMDDTLEAGAKWIVQAGYPGGRYTKLDQVRKLADTFNRVGELAVSKGLKFGYHNHREEFRAIENRIPYQMYIELTEKNLVAFQMDIGHAANEMADYLIYLIKYPGRFGLMHICDSNIFTKSSTEVGQGDVRLKEVFDLFANAGVEDYYVEQERYNYEPLTSIKMCYDYLNKAKFVKW